MAAGRGKHAAARGRRSYYRLGEGPHVPGRTFKLDRLTVELVEGDITELEADAIVNAANSYLKHGGGVAAAIVRKGGYVIQEESDRWVRERGPVPVGSVAVTSAGRLKARYVIHAVGPRFGEEGGDEKLASAIRSSLEKSEELGLRSVALPAISTGVFGYPYERCARIMARELKAFAGRARSLERVIVCLYGREAYETFERVFLEELRE
ncbi:MAG: ADP-ribose-binding protein [Thermofilaceae archaeon]